MRFFQSCIGESLFTCGPGLRDEEASQFPRGMSVEGQEGSLYGDPYGLYGFIVLCLLIG